MTRLKEYLRHEQPDWHRILLLLRYELEMWTLRAQAWLSPSSRRELQRLRHQRGLKLNIASGADTIPGWISVDASRHAHVRADLRRRLPFADNSAALLYSEHFLDHLQYPDVAGRVLRECRRILEPGGRLRLALHDGELLVSRYLARDQRWFEGVLQVRDTAMETVNFLFRFNNFHQFIYDYETLERLLLTAGFRTVKRSGYRASEVPELNIDSDNPTRRLECLYVEAIK